MSIAAARFVGRRVNLVWTLDQQKEEYLELNPYGQVPVAVFDGETWLDSNAICILLAERMPQAGLIPSSARQRAIFWQSLAVSATSLELPAVNYLLSMRGFVDPAWKGLVGEAISARMQAFADRLPVTDYLCGPFSLADICAAYVLRIAIEAELLSCEGNLADYVNRLRARPAAIQSRIFDSLDS
jgi:glutathione S-transferase